MERTHDGRVISSQRFRGDLMTQSQISALDKCLLCRESAVPSGGYIVCRNCGNVIRRDYQHGIYLLEDNILPHGKSGRKSGYSQSVYYGNRPDIADGLGSSIGFRYDHNFKDLSHRQASRFRRLKHLQKRTLSPTMERTKRILRTLNHISSLIPLSHTVKCRAAQLFKKSLKGWGRKSGYVLLMACISTAIKEYQIPLRDCDILEVMENDISTRQIIKAKFWLQDHLDRPIEFVRPERFVPRLISHLRNDPKFIKKVDSKGLELESHLMSMEREAIAMLESMTSLDYVGRDPMTLAASCLYALDRYNGRACVLTQKSFIGLRVEEFSIRCHLRDLWKPRFAEVG